MSKNDFDKNLFQSKAISFSVRKTQDNVRELLELNLNPVQHFEEVIVEMDSVGQKTVQKGSLIGKLADQKVFIYRKFQVVCSNMLWI